MPLIPNITNKPLMIEGNYLNTMLTTKINISDKEAVLVGAEANYNIKNNNAIIQVIGPLSMRSDFWTWYFGGSSYEVIRQDFKAALDDNEVETIIFEIDSPGGEVSGLFDLVDEIKSARGQKKIIAVINEIAYSAAYAIASAADEIYITKTGGAGSIGVIAMHTDISKMNEAAGIKYTPIFNGARKNDFTPHEPLTQEAYNVVKSEVDDIADIFISTVANNRGLSPDTIKNMQAGIFQGQKAINAGLADEIKSLSNILTPTGGTNMSKKLVETLQSAIKGVKSEDILESMAELGYIPKEGMVSNEDHKKALDAQAEEANKKFLDSIDSIKAETSDSVKKEIISILELCSIGGVDNMGLKMINEGITAKEAKKRIFDSKVPTQTVNSTVNPMHAGEVNPLLADAEKRVKEAK